MEREIEIWDRKGRPAPPPPEVKRRVLRAYAREFGLKVLVETGTYHGDTVEALRGDFDRIISVELGRELFEKARERFREATHIEIIHGDSGEVLENVVGRIGAPALFYLDGHYSAGETARGRKDTPIYEELDHILKSSERRHVIVIDDARCFGTEPGYPSLQELKDFVCERRNDVQIRVEDDSIRITSK